MGKPNHRNPKKVGEKNNKPGENRSTFEPRSKCVLNYKTAQPNSLTITAKFKDSEDNEVKESINVWKDGDPKDTLIELQKRVFQTFGNRYDYYEDGKAKMLSQTYGRCLIGSCEEEWNTLCETVGNWKMTSIKAKMKKLLQKHAVLVIGRKAYEQQQDAMEEGMRKPKGMTLTAQVKRLFRINEDMMMLTEDGESYTQSQMAKKIIYKSLTGSARVKYVEKGGKNKNNKAEILEIIEEIEEAIEVQREVDAEAHQNSRNNRDYDRRNGDDGNNNDDGDNNRNGNKENNGEANNGDNNGDKSEKEDPRKTNPNPCGKPGHKHDWRDCPENKYSKKYEGGNDDEKKGGENHSIAQQSSNSAPVVTFQDDDDFTFSDDDSVAPPKGEHMMIAKSLKEDMHPVTIISLKKANGETVATTCLIDLCFTGGLLMTAETANQLGLTLVEAQSGTKYTTAAGILKTTHKVTVEDIKLPCLSKTRRFSGEFEIIPEGANASYGVFLGSVKMRELDIDTSVRDNTISWGEDLAIQMVRRGHWTPERIQMAISRSKRIPEIESDEGTLKSQVQFAGDGKDAKEEITSQRHFNLLRTQNQISHKFWRIPISTATSQLSRNQAYWKY